MNKNKLKISDLRKRWKHGIFSIDDGYGVYITTTRSFIASKSVVITLRYDRDSKKFKSLTTVLLNSNPIATINCVVPNIESEFGLADVFQHIESMYYTAIVRSRLQILNDILTDWYIVSLIEWLVFTYPINGMSLDIDIISVAAYYKDIWPAFNDREIFYESARSINDVTISDALKEIFDNADRILSSLRMILTTPDGTARVVDNNCIRIYR